VDLESFWKEITTLSPSHERGIVNSDNKNGRSLDIDVNVKEKQQEIEAAIEIAKSPQVIKVVGMK